jgi:hypothetical protein
LTVKSLLKAPPIRSGRDVVARTGFRVLWLAIGGAIATVVGLFLLDLPPTSEGVTFVAGGSVIVVLAGILLDAYRLPSRHFPPA